MKILYGWKQPFDDLIWVPHGKLFAVEVIDGENLLSHSTSINCIFWKLENKKIIIENTNKK